MRTPLVDPIRERRRNGIRFAAVVTLALALYVRTLTFDFTYLDDNTLILDQQSFLAQSSSPWRSFARPFLPSAARDHTYYRPLVNASFALDAQWSGTNARGYHLTNVLLHALAAGLLFLLLRRLGGRDNVALWGGLVFAAHPALTEAVTWIPGRTDILLTVCAIASWLLLPRPRKRTRATGPDQRSAEPDEADPPDALMWVRRVGHLLAWLAALFSKEAAVVLPLVYLAHLRLWERHSWRRVFAPWLLAGWGVTLGVYLAARAAVVPEGMGLAGVSALNVFSNVPVLLISSFGKLTLPVHLAVLAIPEDTSLWPGAAAAGLMGAALFVPRIQRAPILFGIGSFIAFVLPGLPASNLLILESRLYLPAIAIVIGVCALANQVDRLPARAVGAGGIVIVGLLAITSFNYSGDFRDRLTFSRAAVRGSPHSALAHRNLGVAYQIAGDDDSARRSYEWALAQDAGEPVVHNNLAVILMAKGQLAEAERELRQELAINPRYADAHNNLARVLEALGRTDEAAGHWEIHRGLAR